MSNVCELRDALIARLVQFIPHEAKTTDEERYHFIAILSDKLGMLHILTTYLNYLWTINMQIHNLISSAARDLYWNDDFMDCLKMRAEDDQRFANILDEFQEMHMVEKSRPKVKIVTIYWIKYFTVAFSGENKMVTRQTDCSISSGCY